MADNLLTAGEAFVLAASAISPEVAALSSSFVCPFPNCRSYALHYWGSMNAITVRVNGNSFNGRNLTAQGGRLIVAKCTACQQEAIWLDGLMVKPATSDAPAPADDMPADIRGEYAEAANILPSSPRGSAALLRLAVQKLLPLLGAKTADINGQIGELVSKRVISARVQESLDTLRVIGNEAVHPGTIDLNDDRETAMGLFRLLNFIIEKAISDPKHAEEMFSKLPQNKRDGIEQRDKKAREADPA